MLREFNVQNFRGFRDLTVDPLGRVNLIAGMNNTGKSSLLEAIYIQAHSSNPGLIKILKQLRGIETDSRDLLETSGWFFPYRHTSDIIRLKSDDDENGAKETTIVFLNSPAVSDRYPEVSRDARKHSAEFGYTFHNFLIFESTYSGGKKTIAYYIEETRLSIATSLDGNAVELAPFLSTQRRAREEDIKEFSKIETEERQDDIVPELQILEPRLIRLSLASLSGSPTLFANMGIGRLMPLSFLGEGVNRLLSILLAIANCPDGIVMIDEIENGLHHSIMQKVWQAIGQAARRHNVQVFATTHSYECIRAAHEAFSESETYDLRLHRLERDGDQIKAVTYDKETLGTSVEMALEVR